MSIDCPTDLKRNGSPFDYTKISVNLEEPQNGDVPKNVTVYIANGERDGQLVPATINQGLDVGDEDEDPWVVGDDEDDGGEKWAEMSHKTRVKSALICICKVLGLLLLLYTFICSLSFLSDAFRLLGGKTAGRVFSQNKIITNPVAGLMIGILATVLVQSSSTSTSIVVTMCASGIIDVRPAIPIIMGANIGTSLTNTIVSLAQSPDRNQFRRAFAGATVHDMFNWLSVLLLLPLEVMCGFLYQITACLVKLLNLSSQSGSKPKLLKVLTDPLTKRVIQLDKKLIEDIAVGENVDEGKSLVKEWCKVKEVVVSVNQTMWPNNSLEVVNETRKVNVEKCNFLLHDTGIGDTYIGLILLVVSLFAMCTALVFMVKLLSSMLRGHIAAVIKRTINSDFPGCLSWLAGYIAIVVGAIMTILVQSSSIFTSTLTPLVGLGVITIDRMYPLTLGSNIGTTATGLLAAMANSDGKLQSALQIALCHLFFNVSGILLFYPVPFMRLPVKLAKILGNTTARYRWFAVFYLLIMFFVLPAIVFSLSLSGIDVMLGVGMPLLVIFALIIVINVMQRKCPQCLPKVLKTWHFLPKCLHSLDPLDAVLTKMLLQLDCCRCCITAAITVPPTHAYRTANVEARDLLATGSLASSAASSAMPSRIPSRVNLSHSPSQFTLENKG